MKKKKILLFMYTVLFMVCFFSGLNGLGRVSATDGDPNSEEEGIDYNYNEEGELMEGDEGLSDEVLDALYSPDPSTAFLDVKEVTDRARTMAVTAIEYNGQIPFVKDKTEFQKGYSPLYCFYPDSERTTTFGMGYEGYIQWLYLNAFGYVPESVCDILKSARDRERDITIDELQTGDIGIKYDKDTGTHLYGVCIGELDGKHVFSFQSTRGYNKLYTGSNRIGYLKAETQDYLCLQEPVEYDFFFRPDVIWDIEKDTTEIIEEYILW